jgi:transposase-like protein
MSGKRYPEEFKIEAVKQVVDRGYSVSSVATRLDITTHSLYAWIKKYGPDSSTNKEQSDAQAEIRRLQKELKRVTDERDILKKPRRTSQSCRLNTPSSVKHLLLVFCSVGCWISSQSVFTPGLSNVSQRHQVYLGKTGLYQKYWRIRLPLGYRKFLAAGLSAEETSAFVPINSVRSYSAVACRGRVQV